MKHLAEFQSIPTRCGLPSAVHVPSSILIHSRINPAGEADQISLANKPHCTTPSTVLIGGGLGYLPEAILKSVGCAHEVYVIEPNPELFILAQSTRSGSDYLTSPHIHVMTVSTQSALVRCLGKVPTDARMVISPYLLRLSAHLNFPLSDYLRVTRSELASAAVYNPLLSSHRAAASTLATDLPAATTVRLPNARLTAVVGAGPSLDACLPWLRANRTRLVLLAASGAVPALLAADVVPNWVFALEAKDTVLRDLQHLPLGTKVVVFPSTHPAVLAERRYSLIAGNDGEGNDLETRGGSSVIPAVDFALRACASNILLVGMDLSNSNGAYASASNRDAGAANAETPAPKFLSMRVGIETLLSSFPERLVYHVLEAGTPLKGSRLLSPGDLETILDSHVAGEVPRD